MTNPHAARKTKKPGRPAGRNERRRKPSLLNRLAPRFHAVEKRLDRWRYRWDLLWKRFWNPRVDPYAALLRPDRVRVFGRAFQQPPPRPHAVDSRWHRFVTMLRRMITREIPHARIETSIDGTPAGVHEADDEGVLNAELREDGIELRAARQIALRIVEPAESPPAIVRPSSISTLGPNARYVVVSDIDDTVMKMKVLGARRLLSTIVFADAKRRATFDGVPAFYRALAGERDENPTVYVSSSPWNVHDVIQDFLALQSMPRGALLLRNWGISDREVLPTRHAAYKDDALRRVLDFFDPLPVILCGDDGAEDPAIYADIARSGPERVAAVFIRRLRPDDRERTEALALLGRELHEHGIPFLATDSAREMLGEARRLGLVASSGSGTQRETPPLQTGSSQARSRGR